HHHITSTYCGDGSFTGMSVSVTQPVSTAYTPTTYTSLFRSSVFGQSVTFTATVSAVAPGAGTATGQVTFSEGSTTLGVGTLSGGVATFASSSLSVGTHTVTATYGGNSSFNGSSGSVAQTVNK